MDALQALALAKKYTAETMQGAGAIKGDKGDPGYSPTVTTSDIDGGHEITITDTNGMHSFDVMDGENGKTYVPQAGTVETLQPNENASASITINEEDLTAKFNFSIPKGEKGESGIIQFETINNTETELDVTVMANKVLRILKPVEKLNVSVESVNTYAEWNFIFTVSETGCVLTLPSFAVWDGNEPPDLEPKKTYEVSISNMAGIAYISKGAII